RDAPRLRHGPRAAPSWESGVARERRPRESRDGGRPAFSTGDVAARAAPNHGFASRQRPRAPRNITRSRRRWYIRAVRNPAIANPSADQASSLINYSEAIAKR